MSRDLSTGSVEDPEYYEEPVKPHHFYGFFGLFIKESRVAIPLKQICTQAKVTNGVVRVT